ncbi:Autoinducer 2 sensor kinase/phosphatase LuxQ [Pigmentiphaga humi]|uniref:histidine kinase n=1 Tax=Pigmentiphaga humi TaxID=2478468 RepID=A0A3P4AXC9_9BURK|nr:response regulator [Pigmentiphaga humi]VCU68026.1 Autoinducer 2 sensor kinase/phosphatase LuxQ [Pigmentiphaga humi]
MADHASAVYTVLVVDDNPVTRYATARTLRTAGFGTAEAETGAQALQLAQSGISAVVLDVHLPDMNGFEVCRALRAQPDSASLPVVHLSAAHVRDTDKVQGLEAGANAYLTHPAEPAVLLATVAALLRARDAELAMRQSEARFRAIYNQAVGGICLLDPQGRLAEVNPALLSLLDRTAAQLLNHEVAQFAPAEWAERVRTATRTVHPSGWQGTLPLLDSGGAVVHLEWNISAPLDNGTKVAVISNVTERVQLEAHREKLLEREQAARSSIERLNRMKDDFIAILSHELRTPLNAIAMWTQFLGLRAKTPETRRGIESIDHNIKLQQRLISDLVDVSMLNVGKMTLERSMADPLEVAREAVQSVQPLVEKKHVRLTLDLPPDGGRKFWLDADRLQQILWNLLSNAIKFSPDHGEVVLSATLAHDELALSVRDQGKGISADFLPHVFDRFTQDASPNNRKHGGLGLGLSIVRHLAELHGGTASVYSAGEGLGATFSIRLPALDAPSGAARSEQPDEPAPDIRADTHRHLANLDILVVEDDDDAREVLSILLQERGARPRMAVSYEDAWTQLNQRRPDLLISDIGLPGKDGYQLLRDLRQQEREAGRVRLPTVALTAFSRQQDLQMAMEVGFDAHCAKPIRVRSLMTAIQDALGRSATPQ